MLAAGLSVASTVRSRSIAADVGWAGLSVCAGDLWTYLEVGPWTSGLVHVRVIIVLLWAAVVAVVAYAARPPASLHRRGFEVSPASNGSAPAADPGGPIHPQG
jgi:hypothetical protein